MTKIVILLYIIKKNLLLIVRSYLHGKTISHISNAQYWYYGAY